MAFENGVYHTATDTPHYPGDDGTVGDDLDPDPAAAATFLRGHNFPVELLRDDGEGLDAVEGLDARACGLVRRLFRGDDRWPTALLLTGPSAEAVVRFVQTVLPDDVVATLTPAFDAAVGLDALRSKWVVLDEGRA